MFQPTNLAEQIADYMADLVIQNEWPPGSRIPEVQVAKEFGVSRGSLRESLLILDRRHLIDLVPRRGARVSGLVSNDALELMDVIADNTRRLTGKRLHARDGLADVSAAVEQMEHAAKNGEAKSFLVGRQSFYNACLVEESRLTIGLFGYLIPSSHRVIWYLHEREWIDLDGVARYYAALQGILTSGDLGPLDQVLTEHQHFMQDRIAKALTG